jgi:pyrroloquinoline quinone biosynthesis protein D
MSISDNKVFTLADSVSFQPLGDNEGAVVLLVKSGDIFTCNDTTTAFLSALDGKTNFAQSLDRLVDQFDVDLDLLRADIEKLAANLVEEGIIV